MNEWVNDVIEVQKNYLELGESVPFTKPNMIKAVAPFRDKYNLSDLDALRIARNELDLSEVREIMLNSNKVEV